MNVLERLWSFVLRPESGPIGRARAWKEERESEIASWWTHERIVQLGTWGILAVAAALELLGAESALSTGTLLAAGLVFLYWLREIVPAALDSDDASTLDRVVDWLAAWWGFLEALLMIYGAVALASGAVDLL